MARYNELENVKINFNVTVQNYNLLNLKELYDLLHEWENKYSRVDANSAFTTICNNPNYLSPLNVPDEMRDIALQQLDGIDDFKTLVKSLKNRQFDEDRWATFINFTKDLDNLRKDSIVEHCPEFAEYFS